MMNYIMIPSVEVIEKLLKREWYTIGGERDKGALFNQHLNVLLEVSVTHMCMFYV